MFELMNSPLRVDTGAIIAADSYCGARMRRN
jgi:hypothetical protein